MDEQAFFLAAAVFLIVLTFAMARLGSSIGGGAWAASWFCLFSSGLAVPLSVKSPIFLPAVPALGTAFAVLLFGGSLLFAGRCERFPRKLVMLGLLVAALRMIVQPFVSSGTSQVIGSVVITAAALGSSAVLLWPQDRTAQLWERILGFAFPSLAAVSIFYSASWLMNEPAPTALMWWLLVSNGIGFLQVGAFIEHATNRIAALRSEADRSRSAHAEVESRYREFTEQASEMITEMDETGTILYANPVHETTLGFKLDELVGQHVTMIFPSAVTIDYGAVFKNQVSMPPHQRVIVVRHRTGRELTLECNLRPFSLASGENRLIVTSRDITDRIAAERAREEGREELETLVEEQSVALETSLQELERSQRLASIGTLAAGIAHQINNPIGSIQMGSELALSAEGNSDERILWRRAIENSIEQAKRCGQIVSSVLQFARNEPTLKSELDLADVLHRVCEQTESYATDQRATIDRSGIEAPLPVFGSAIELEQAILNIVRNAAESSSDRVRIVIRATRVAELVRVTIADDGRGMDQKEVDRAFDPFFTTRLGHGGTGLGLSVAHGIITDHGGSLAVESEPGVGTKLILSIPLQRTS